MVKSFPMVAFHTDTQRLAVGTPQGPISIYDIRTSTKWKVLEGHKARVTVVAYDTKGNTLVSYAPAERSFRIWRFQSQNFIGALFSGGNRGNKEI